MNNETPPPAADGTRCVCAVRGEAGVQVDARESPVRDGVDSLDADVAQLSHRRAVGENLGQPGRADRLGVRAGPSTGTNIYGALRLACELHEHGRTGSIVTLMCDRSDRYDTSFGDDGWLREQDIDPAPYREVLETAWSSLSWTG